MKPSKLKRRSLASAWEFALRTMNLRLETYEKLIERGASKTVLDRQKTLCRFSRLELDWIEQVAKKGLGN